MPTQNLLSGPREAIPPTDLFDRHNRYDLSTKLIVLAAPALAWRAAGMESGWHRGRLALVQFLTNDRPRPADRREKQLRGGAAAIMIKAMERCDMKLPEPQWANCFFFLCYLLLRGRAARLVAVNSRSRWFPWHLVTLSPQGHALHFQAELEHRQNVFAPWWFQGKVVGIGRRKQLEALNASDRTVCWQTNSKLFIASFAFGLVACCLAPWVIAWACWQPLWMLAGMSSALRRRAGYRRPATISQQQPARQLTLKLHVPESADVSLDHAGRESAARVIGNAA